MASNRTSYTDPAGGTSTYAYDGLNRLTDITNSWAGHFGFSYDALSRRTAVTRPNGVATGYKYDNLSQLLSVIHGTGPKPPDGADYGYDVAGNRTAKQNLLSGMKESYAYDAIYRLTQVTQMESGAENTSEQYSYDAVGNRLSVLGAGSYSISPSNQLLSTPTVSYTYDNNGNMLTKADASGTTRFAWDGENRLTQVTKPDGTAVTFKYDPFGRRIQKASTGAITNFVYDGANTVAEYDGAGDASAWYAQGPGIDQPLAIQRGGAIGFYHADGLGSITSITDRSGVILNNYAYDSFGRLTSEKETIPNPFRYTGREWDQETGLYYYRARYYDPTIGRFISEDPIRFEGSGANFYAYSFNDPVGMVDPSGLCSRPSFAALWKNYPAPDTYPTAVKPSGQTSIWDLIGGKVGQNGNSGAFANSCAVRMSYALNQSGCKIPYVKGKTVSGANGDWYFYRVADLLAFIESQWGAPQQISPNNWKGTLSGQTGIIEYEIHWADATGHFSLWNGQTNVDGPAHEYSNPQMRNNAPFNGIAFWPLK